MEYCTNNTNICVGVGVGGGCLLLVSLVLLFGFIYIRHLEKKYKIVPLPPVIARQKICKTRASKSKTPVLPLKQETQKPQKPEIMIPNIPLSTIQVTVH